VRFVLDASVAVSWLLADGSDADAASAIALLHGLRAPGVQAVVPATWFLEIANVLARSEVNGIVTANQSQAFISLLAQLPVVADAETAAQCSTATLDVARRYGLSAYDASYLELALRTQLPLATFDQELRRAAMTAGVAAASDRAGPE
jgi:predicted nucleic acid-binding protein